MPAINERHVLIILLIVLSVATLFCLLGLAIPSWGGYSLFKYSATSTVALCIISLLLLIACVVVTVIILLNLMQNAHLPLIFVILLIVTSIFLLSSFTSFISGWKNHSYNLVVTSFTFTYLSSLAAVYWLFGLRQGGGSGGGSGGSDRSSNQDKRPRLDVNAL